MSKKNSQDDMVVKQSSAVTTEAGVDSDLEREESGFGELSCELDEIASLMNSRLSRSRSRKKMCTSMVLSDLGPVSRTLSPCVSPRPLTPSKKELLNSRASSACRSPQGRSSTTNLRGSGWLLFTRARRSEGAAGTDSDTEAKTDVVLERQGSGPSVSRERTEGELPFPPKRYGDSPSLRNAVLLKQSKHSKDLKDDPPSTLVNEVPMVGYRKTRQDYFCTRSNSCILSARNKITTE
mmetsp:Transcript_13234/g.28725  ORF Transcript_13234/g.28725 Transcript_13234/m.28725 type:complete len:237 (-) Transcript_13234:38-748(-)